MDGGSGLCTPGLLSPPWGSLLPLHRAQVGNHRVKASGEWKGKVLEGREG